MDQRGSDLTTTRWTLSRVGLDEADRWAVLGNDAMARASDVDLYGHDDLSRSVEDITTWLGSQDYTTRVLLVATDGPGGRPEDVLGAVAVSMPRRGNRHAAWLEVRVHPAHRRRGIGTELLRAGERVATQHGRTSLMIESEHAGEPPADHPDVLRPPTGSGRVLRTDPPVGLLRRHGYELEQAERWSALDLPVDPALLARLHDDAAATAGPDYRTLWWADRAPDEWIDQFALLNTRMSTDAPSAGLDLDEEPYDAERIRTHEREIAERGNAYLVVAAEHVPTRTLAAFTMVELPYAKPHVVYQEDTLVLREHRGRRLGMLVKTEMLTLLRRHRPGATAVHTWNAEENGHMLAINVALGFRPVAVTGAWQRRVAAG